MCADLVEAPVPVRAAPVVPQPSHPFSVGCVRRRFEGFASWVDWALQITMTIQDCKDSETVESMVYLLFGQPPDGMMTATKGWPGTRIQPCKTDN